APRVTAALEGVKGVDKVTVDFETESAKVDAKGGICSTDGAKSLVTALKDAGFGGSVKAIDKAASPKTAKAAGDSGS
ncbi:MAG: heavy metal-associated domain-containing protein, partial [Myxococcota bacterium]|nr:heavy metal-associated domain-containing protein [Myxococcota bacterium]